MGEFLKNIAGKVPSVRLAKQKATQNISTYFKGAKIVSKQREAKIVYDASKSKIIKPKKTANKAPKKITNNKLLEGCSNHIMHEDIENNNNNNNVQKCDSNYSDAACGNNQQLCFSMLFTDDEDDYDYENDDSSSDEEIATSNNNRPPPPEWSFAINRKSIVIQQTEINHSVIDKFFGCEAELIDMLEIFPKMNPRKAKRRKSSIKWDSPLLIHSVLPKY